MLRGDEPTCPDLIAPSARSFSVVTRRGIASHHTIRRLGGPLANGADAHIVDHVTRFAIEGVTPPASAGITHAPDFAAAEHDIFRLGLDGIALRRIDRCRQTSAGGTADASLLRSTTWITTLSPRNRDLPGRCVGDSYQTIRTPRCPGGFQTHASPACR